MASDDLVHKYRELLKFHYPSMQDSLELLSDEEMALVVQVAFELAEGLGMNAHDFERFQRMVEEHSREHSAPRALH